MKCEKSSSNGKVVFLVIIISLALYLLVKTDNVFLLRMPKVFNYDDDEEISENDDEAKGDSKAGSLDPPIIKQADEVDVLDKEEEEQTEQLAIDDRLYSTPWIAPPISLGSSSSYQESQVEFEKRFKDWKSEAIMLLEKYSDSNQRIKYSPYGVQQLSPRFSLFVRTAIALSQRVVVIVPIDAPGVELDVVNITSFLTNSKCMLGAEPCSCELLHCHCRTMFKPPGFGGDTRIPKIMCRTKGDVDFGKVAYLQFFNTTNSANLVKIPLENVERKIEDLHVCNQGFYYLDEGLPPMPAEVMETYLAHYARLGASHFHLFTNTLSKPYLQFKLSLRVPKGLTVWIHDFPLPIYRIRNTKWQSNLYQAAIANYCIARAYAMGARYVLMSDFDEFWFLARPNAVSIVKEFDDYLSTSPEKRIIWLKNKLFKTDVCVKDLKGRPPNQFHNFTEHMVISAIDQGSKAKETKGMIRLDGTDPEFIGKILWYVHSAIHADAWKYVGPGEIPDLYKRNVSYELESPTSIAVLRHYRMLWNKACIRIFNEQNETLPRNEEILHPPQHWPSIQSMFEEQE
jgi:hypothetical protein